MKVYALLFLLLSQSSFAVAPNESFLEGAWLEADSNWVNAPKYVVSREQWSQTAVLYLGKDHKFALICCTVIRVPNKYMNISNGDPRGVYRGEWSIHDDTVSLTYQLVEQTVLKVRSYRVPFSTQISTFPKFPFWASTENNSVEKWLWTKARLIRCFVSLAETSTILYGRVNQDYRDIASHPSHRSM
jgi:hypothetical protein